MGFTCLYHSRAECYVILFPSMGMSGWFDIVSSNYVWGTMSLYE